MKKRENLIQTKFNFVERGITMGILAATIKRVNHVIEKITVILAILSVGMMSVSLLLAVASRYIFKVPIVWADEMSLFLLAWTTFLGASLSVKRNEMVAATFLIERFNKTFNQIAQILIQALILLLSLVLLNYAFKWAFSPNTFQIKSSAMQLPMWIPYSIFPITMLFTSLFSVENIIKIINSK